MITKIIKVFIKNPWLILIIIIGLIYYQFTFEGKIPIPTDAMVAIHYPWLDFKWGYTVGVPFKNPILSDAFSQFYVWRQIIVDIYQDGSIPLWNKYAFSGTPLLATFHSAVLFPGNIFLFIPQIGWGVFVFMSTIFASLTMYLFLGNITKYKLTRLIGSLIFAFAGPMTTWVEFGTGVWAAAFLPLCLFCIDQIIIKKQTKYRPLLSLSIFLLCLSGHVQLMTYALIILPIYVFYRLKQNPHLPLIKSLLQIGIFIFLGVSLAAIQIIPTLSFFKESIRTEEKYIYSVNSGLIPLHEMIRLFAADFFGHPSTMNHFSKAQYDEQSSYLGAITLPLILTLIFSRNKKKPWFLIILFIVSILMTIDSPVSRFIFSLPLPLLTYSKASRVLFVTSFSAGALAAIGFESLKEKRNRKNLFLFCIFEIIIILFAITKIDSTHQSISIKNSILYLGIIGSFLGIFIFKLKSKLLIFLLTLLLLSFDLGRYFVKFNPFVNQNIVFPNTPITDFLKKQPGNFRIGREDVNLLPTNTWMAYKLESIEGYDPLYSRDYGHFFHVVQNKPYSNGVSRFAKLQDFNPKFLDSLNVKYVLVTNISIFSDKLKENNYQLAFEDGSVRIFESPTVKKRAFFVDNYRIVNDETELIAALEDNEFDPRYEAIIKIDKLDLILPKIHGQINNFIHSNNTVTFYTSTTDTEFLVLADSYTPDWKAYINNQETKIYQVNGALRGIVIPPGENHVIFKYQPRSFFIGIIISFFSLTILFILSQFTIFKYKLPRNE